MHFCIFFAPETVGTAVKTLLENGAVTKTQTTAVLKWEYHDLGLSGTPIDFAASTRNRQLVQLLLPHSEWRRSLDIGISNFFWDIAGDILDFVKDSGETLPDYPDIELMDMVHRPFLHWIAHGTEHATAIEATVELCRDHGIITEQVQELLRILTMQVKVEDDVVLVDSLIPIASVESLKEKDELGIDVLQQVVSRAKNQAMWRGSLRRILEHYSLAELEENLGIFDSYLDYAISSDSPVGARILLKKGVDVNQRSRVWHGQTPLQSAIGDRRSPELVTLLVDFGADINIEDPVLERGSYEHQLLRTQANFESVESVIRDKRKESVMGDLLHRNLIDLLLESARLSKGLSNSFDYFRYLLGRDDGILYVNCTDQTGATMIQRAAAWLDVNTVNVLLESKADANIAFPSETVSLFPLQIACIMGRLLWELLTAIGRSEAELVRRRAYKFALELLKWHHARADSTFQGITPLHLASFLLMSNEVQKLKAAGFSCNAKGNWPGQGAFVTAQDLVDVDIHTLFVDALAVFTQKNDGYPGSRNLSTHFMDLQALKLDEPDFKEGTLAETKSSAVDYDSDEDDLLPRSDLWDFIKTDNLDTEHLDASTIVAVQQQISACLQNEN